MNTALLTKVMKTAISLALVATLVGPPAPDRGRTVSDLKELHRKHGAGHWIALGLAAVGTSIAAYEVSKPKTTTLYRRLVGPGCAINGCVPSGGY